MWGVCDEQNFHETMLSLATYDFPISIFCILFFGLEKSYSWAILQFEKQLYSVSNPCIKCIKDKLEIGKHLYSH